MNVPEEEHHVPRIELKALIYIDWLDRQMNKKHVALIFAVSLMFLTTTSLQPTTFATTNSVIAPSIEWAQEYGTGNLIQAMVQTNDGGYALAGVAMSIVIGGVGPWLIKVDSSGNKQWEQFYFDKKMNTNLGGANSIVMTSDGGYALAGGSYLYKTNSTGNLQWRQFYSGIEISSLANTGDGYTLGGSKNGSYWLAKVDPAGQIIWNQTYGGETDSRSWSMIQTSDGGYAMAGTRNTNSSAYNIWLIKTDSLGNMLWNQSYGIPLSSAYSVIQAKDGGYVLAGTLNDSVLLIKTDVYGKMVWNQTYSSEVAWSAIQTNDGGYTLTCSEQTSSGSLVKTDSDGNEQWSLASNVTLYSVVQTSDGGYAFVGGNGVGSCWLTKTSASSNSPSLSPSPTVPEFPWLILLPLFIFLLSIAVTFRLRKTWKIIQY